MSKTQNVMSAIVCAGCVLVSATAAAQMSSAPPAPQVVPVDMGAAPDITPKAYGTTATTVVKIHGTAFRSQSSGDKLDAYWDTGITFRSAGDVAYMLHAPVQLPAGALVTQVGFDGYDVDPTLNINWGIYWVSQSNADTTGHIAWYSSSYSGGAFNTTADITQHTVDSGKYYFALVQLPKLGQDLAIKGMRITYKLQVSPAPVTASFTDVPVGHWAFQYVEAMKASGITTGTSPTTFSPDGAVTRAQLAVFLSRALGLHYPN